MHARHRSSRFALTVERVPVFLVAFGAAVAAWYVLVEVPAERARLVQEVERRLGASVEGTSALIAAWVDHCKGDALTPCAFPSVTERIAEVRASGGVAPKHVTSVLTSYARTQGYERAFVLDRDQGVFAASDGAGPLWPACTEAARVGRRRDVPVFHAHPDGRPFVAFRARIDGDGGSVLLESDPARWLHPALASRVLDEASGETLLVERDGQDVVFLSPLRFASVPPLTRRPAAATRGLTDYRGVPVLTAGRTVPGTDWEVIAKVDREEALAPFRGHVRDSGIAGASVLVGAIAITLALWFAQRRRQAHELDRSRTRLALTLEQANDPILFLAPDGTIREANRRAEELFGGDGVGLHGRSVADLRPEGERSSWPGQLARLRQEGALVFETVHRTRGGALLPVEVSARHVTVAGESVVVELVRDVSDRVRHRESLEARVGERTAALEATEQSLRESEERFRIAQDFSVNGFAIWRSVRDESGAVVDFEGVYVNPAAAATLGHTVEELTGGRLLGTEAEGSPLAALVTRWARVAETGTSDQDELALDVGDGPRWLRNSAVRLRDGVATWFEDVSERKRAEEVLRASHEALEERVRERTFHVERLNRMLRTLSDVNELLVRESDPELFLAGACRIIAERGDQVLVWIGTPEPDGRVRPSAVAGGGAAYLEGLEVRWDDGPLAQGPAGRAVRERRTVVCPDLQADAPFEPWRARAAEHGVLSGVVVPIRVRGDVARVLCVYSGETGFFDVDVVELLEELATEVGLGLQAAEDRRALRASESKLRNLSRAVEQSPVSIVITDPAGTIEYVNPKFCEVTGFSSAEAVGKNPRVLKSGEVKSDVYADLWRTITSGREWRGEFRNRKKSGEIFTETATISPIRDEDGVITHFVGVKEDVTERLRNAAALEHVREQLLHSQKMEAIGRLAGGVAHDFNNLLTVIDGYGRMVLEGLREDDPARARLEQVVRAGERAAGLTRQLLAFSRKLPASPRILDLARTVRDMEKMCRRLIGEDLELEVVADADAGDVRADPGQIEQVVMNLLVNARDATSTGGKVKIEVSSVELDEAEARALPTIAPGRFVRLAVSDTGIGMDARVKARIFEPFFTTKEPGKGTGLGLATVYGIVQQSGGAIRVESEPGKGARFEVFLPRTDEGPDAAGRAAAPAAPVPRGSEVVLLVEDEECVRELMREVLESFGYRVLVAALPAEALEIAGSFEGRIDLLLTDVVMPQLGGTELAAAVRRARPGIKVIFVSGYPGEAQVDPGGDRCLAKPVLPKALAQAVRDALDGVPGRDAGVS